jgi:SWI/SNF-related matrix-associated actin-dependent regulator of chromatin subfamily A-like protein 1
MRCYFLSGMAKLQSVKEYVTAILENDVKIVIFAHHKVIMDVLECHIKSLKYQYIRLDGESSPETRKKKVDLFQH